MQFEVFRSFNVKIFNVSMSNCHEKTGGGIFAELWFCVFMMLKYSIACPACLKKTRRVNSKFSLVTVNSKKAESKIYLYITPRLHELGVHAIVQGEDEWHWSSALAMLQLSWLGHFQALVCGVILSKKEVRWRHFTHRHQLNQRNSWAYQVQHIKGVLWDHNCWTCNWLQVSFSIHYLNQFYCFIKITSSKVKLGRFLVLLLVCS